MNRTCLRPVPQDLHRNDPYLPELMRYINRLLEGDVAEHVARNASLLYLALVTGFVENDLLQEAWAPRIIINVGNQEYEVRCPSWRSLFENRSLLATLKSRA